VARPRLPGLPLHGLRRGRRRRLDELRRTATEDLIDSNAAADPGQLVPELEAMVREEPLRERQWAIDGRALPSRASGRGTPSLRARRGCSSASWDRARPRSCNDSKRRSSPIPSLGAIGRQMRSLCVQPMCAVQGTGAVRDGRCRFLLRSEQVVAEAIGHLVGEGSSRSSDPRGVGNPPAAGGTRACTRIGRASRQRSVGLLRDPTGQPSTRCPG
jgi:hypothetical protein